MELVHAFFGLQMMLHTSPTDLLFKMMTKVMINVVLSSQQHQAALLCFPFHLKPCSSLP